MNYYTSNYSAIKRMSPRTLLIPITRYLPSYFDPKGRDHIYLQNLAPSKELLINFKNGKIKQKYYEASYRMEMNELKNSRGKLITDYILDQLSGLDMSKYHNVVFLCYCKKGEFCHRHILADIINKENHIHVTEWPG